MNRVFGALRDRLDTPREIRKVLSSSRHLCRQKNHAEAIDLLTDTFRQTGDSFVVRELVKVRNEAMLKGSFSAARSPWPPEVPDLFAGVPGIPEVGVEGFNSASLAAGIMHHGCLIVRGFLSSEQVEKLQESVRRSFEAQDLHARGEATNESLKWYSPFGSHGKKHLIDPREREFVRQGGGVLGIDSPAMVHDVLKLADDKGVVKAVSEFLGEPRPAISVKKTTLRVVPPQTSTGWHQDGAFLGKDVRTVNMWISLSECGEHAPSLDLIPHRFDDIVPTGTEGADFSWSVSDTVASRYAGEYGIHHPHFAPGDAIFFDHMNLHRTGVQPGMTKERLAIEWWFFAPSCFPYEQVPILV